MKTHEIKHDCIYNGMHHDQLTITAIVMMLLSIMLLLDGCSRSVSDDASNVEPPPTSTSNANQEGARHSGHDKITHMETASSNTNAKLEDHSMDEYVELTDDEWKARLTPQQYLVLREKGTDLAFTGDLWNHKGHGIYACAGCGLALFDSDTKFESGSGWPSFTDAVNEKNVATVSDSTFGMQRIEVLCHRCDSHLGHLFDDGPAPTGLRYCINSSSLKFVEREKQ